MKNSAKNMNKIIKIGKRQIGEGFPCFVIAEAGVNHNGDVKKAKLLVDIAKKAGADVVKFQTWITEELLTKDAKQADYQIKNTGNEESQFDMAKALELSHGEFKDVKKYCEKSGIMFLSTPDEEKSLDFLDSLGVSAFKIGSGELNNLLILKKAAMKKKPIILSTGMGNIDEIALAVKTVTKINKSLAILHCTSNYPTNPKDVNLNAMITLKKTFNLVTGYSDHTKGTDVPTAAVILGASIIEKHFTYDKNAPGPDHKASLSPQELSEMVSKIRKIEKMNDSDKKDFLKNIKNINIILGSAVKKPNNEEVMISKLVRKSVVAKKDIPKSTLITLDMLTLKRPGSGIDSRYLPKIAGKYSKKRIAKDELIKWGMIGNKNEKEEKMN